MPTIHELQDNLLKVVSFFSVGLSPGDESYISVFSVGQLNLPQWKWLQFPTIQLPPHVYCHYTCKAWNFMQGPYLYYRCVNVGLWWNVKFEHWSQCTLRTPWWNCYRTATALELLWSRRNITGGALFKLIPIWPITDTVLGWSWILKNISTAHYSWLLLPIPAIGKSVWIVWYSAQHKIATHCKTAQEISFTQICTTVLVTKGLMSLIIKKIIITNITQTTGLWIIKNNSNAIRRESQTLSTDWRCKLWCSMSGTQLSSDARDGLAAPFTITIQAGCAQSQLHSQTQMSDEQGWYVVMHASTWLSLRL